MYRRNDNVTQHENSYKIVVDSSILIDTSTKLGMKINWNMQYMIQHWSNIAATEHIRSLEGT